MKIKFVVITLALMITPMLAKAEPKFVSNINGSSFVINVSNVGSQSYECAYTYTYNSSQQGGQQFNGRVVIEAGANNVAVIKRATDQMISKLNFDYQCKEK